jgi:hypothetical protein
MTAPELQRPARTISGPRWVLATAMGSTLGAVLGGTLITAWLQPFKVVTSPLEAATIAVPRTSLALGVRRSLTPSPLIPRRNRTARGRRR